MRIISGKFRGRVLAAPPKQGVRPTSSLLREALFNICQNEIEGARFLDLFAGTGAMGFEALSRGAASATFVEKENAAKKCILANAEKLGVNIELLSGDLFAMLPLLERQGKSFDIIYADPPYGQGRKSMLYAEELLHALANSPLLAPGGSLFIEETESLTTDWPPLELISHRQHGKAQLWHFRRPT